MGHNNTVQTIATFTGTLLRRERAVGQKRIQLVFRENNENWLCVSADMKHNALVVGKKYRVEGVFRKYGERPYIHIYIRQTSHCIKVGFVSLHLTV